MDLIGKVAVVTGGASGLGRAIAERCVRAGMRVSIADVEEGALARTVRELRDAGAEVIGVPTDVSSVEDVARLRDETLDQLGGAHLLCNNAGIGHGAPLIEVPLERWRWMMDVNVWGLIHCCRTFVPMLVEQDEGHVVNVSSLAGVLAAPTFGAYSTTKAAIVGYSEALAQELRAAGSAVGVSVVCPTIIKTTGTTSDRNKPSYVADKTDSEHAINQALAAAMDAVGMDASEVAATILDGVRTDTFFVFPNQEAADHSIATLVAWMRDGKPPDVFMPFATES
jgi:NAD(P)-dependent dehydrogenase (short-subunit alcohol dehydrogenase family)